MCPHGTRPRAVSRLLSPLTAPNPPVRVRAASVLAVLPLFSALASPSRAICASHGRFTSSRPGVRRSSPRPLAPRVDAISERRGGAPAAVPSTCVGWAIRLLFGLEGAAPERSSAQKWLLPAPCQKGQKHPNFDEKVSFSLLWYVLVFEIVS